MLTLNTTAEELIDRLAARLGDELRRGNICTTEDL